MPHPLIDRLLEWTASRVFDLSHWLHLRTIGRKALKAKKVAEARPGTPEAVQAIHVMEARLHELPSGCYAASLLGQVIRQARKTSCLPPR